ncbi:MAG: DUF3405 domain-containing protein, partial [Candidatus Omnitrophota bacterium]
NMPFAGNYHLFSAEAIAKMGYPNEKNVPLSDNLWHHGDYPVLDYFLKHSAFDYYWKVEFDVRFVGEWSDFFDRFAHDDSDFLATEIKTPRTCPDWRWEQLVSPVPFNERIGCFFPVTRFSRKALEVLDRSYRAGIDGFCEVAVPTTLKSEGLSINDLGRSCYDGSTLGWKRFHRRKRGYLHHPVKKNWLVWFMTCRLRAFAIDVRMWIGLRTRVRNAAKCIRSVFFRR